MESKKQQKIEFIGLEMVVLDSRNTSLIGIKGRVIDETKNIIIIETKDKKIKKLIKKDIIFTIKNKSETHTINGSKITYRPEDRIKRI